MIAVGAGVGDDAILDRGDRAVFFRADLHLRLHRVLGRRADELLLAGELPHHRTPRFERREQRQILAHHVLLAAEAAADAFAEDVHVGEIESEDEAELGLDDERALDARADVIAAVVAPPADRLHRLEMHVLLARRVVGVLVDRVGLAEALLDAADLAVQLEKDVLLGMHRARELALIVQLRRAGPHRFLGIEDGRQNLVLDLEFAAAFFRGGLGIGNDGGDALPDEARDVVEHVGIVGIDAIIFVNRRRVELARDVFPREDVDDAGHGERLRFYRSI